MKTTTLLLTAAIAALFAAPSFAATQIATLDTLQVRPSAEQIAQRNVEQTSGIATLPAVQVRPSAEQIAQREAELSSHIATLAAVQVRPSAEQLAERDLEQAAGQHVVTLATVQVRPDADMGSMLAIGDVVGETLDTAMLQLQPSLQKLGQDLAVGLVR
ncbi:hypothetical protein FHR56_003896 [Xanthomonas sacchari]|uniref:hypothetical protein n=1 Tax=unclassified Xanthomonas TaxID=2643310 RepID=UPI00136E90DE|nr:MULTISPECIES: hypothetical protein [unclassified Xanthomonas]MBB6368715.1 hypothetical protein [Xanthomonas sp. F10]MXV34236.1 hypothetical protein [Xanthomonas sp. LMG 8989]